MSAIRVINGNYRGIPIIDTVFELVSGFQTGAKGSYVTVKNGGVFPKCPETIRVRVEDISDIVYTTGMTHDNVIRLEQPAKSAEAVQETDEQAMDRIRERFDILQEMSKACVAGDIRAMIVSGPPGVGKSFGVEQEIDKALKAQHIETPSWGYANSGTRFKAFAWPGAARTTREKLDDAAMVHKMTGIAPSVAVHIPWDKPEDGDYAGMCQYAESKGITIGAVNPNVFQDDQYRLGSLGNPDPNVQEEALDHMLECCEIMGKLKSNALSLWFADGTNYAGQDSLRGRKRRFEEGLKQVYKELPKNGRMLIEYKFFEPAFYSTDIPDWGTAYAWALKLGPQAEADDVWR